jgi:hypothetical protein
MVKGKSSGISLTNHDASIALGMEARGDRDHDIAAWFGVNQGRIAEVKQGSHGSISASPANLLPPKGLLELKGKGSARLLIKQSRYYRPKEMLAQRRLLSFWRQQRSDMTLMKLS